MPTFDAPRVQSLFVAHITSAGAHEWYISLPPCETAALHQRIWVSALPLIPLMLLSLVLPFFLFYANSSHAVVSKLVLYCPNVLIVLAQLAV